jgi:hypothetical protein
MPEISYDDALEADNAGRPIHAIELLRAFLARRPNHFRGLRLLAWLLPPTPSSAPASSSN